MNSKSLLASTLLGALLLTSCEEGQRTFGTDGVFVDNHCYRVAVANLTFDCDEETFSFGGVTAKVKNPACKPLKVSMCFGVDRNNDRKIAGADEEESKVNDLEVKDCATAGQTGGGIDPGMKGKNVGGHIRVTVEGSEKPLVSTNTWSRI